MHNDITQLVYEKGRILIIVLTGYFQLGTSPIFGYQLFQLDSCLGSWYKGCIQETDKKCA